MQFTTGKFDNGTSLSHVDSSWNAQVAHRPLKRPWKGVTAYFARECECIDAFIAKLVALHDQDQHMPLSKTLRFNETRNEIIEIVLYSQMYDAHPHFILATKTGWKRNPSRADAFTGKTTKVIKDRRKKARKNFSSRSAKAMRKQIIKRATSALSGMDVDTDKYDKMTNDVKRDIVHSSRFTHSPFRQSVNHSVTDTHTNSVPVETSVPVPLPMDVDCHSSDVDPNSVANPMICAASKRTKPVNNAKYQKLLGAKKAKKRKLSEDNELTLSPADATMYRAIAARCNYLAQDRPDIAYSSKELCRKFSIPDMN